MKFCAVNKLTVVKKFVPHTSLAIITRKTTTKNENLKYGGGGGGKLQELEKEPILGVTTTGKVTFFRVLGIPSES